MGGLHWISRAASALSIIVALILTFQYYATQDRSVPFGTQSAFSITAIPADSGKTDIVNLIERAAQQQSLNIYKVTVDPTDVGNGRYLFAFLGDPAKDADLYPGGRYPSFDPGYSTTVKSSRDITTEDIRGLFWTTGDSSATAVLLNSLRRAGFEATFAQTPNNFLIFRTMDYFAAAPIAVATMFGLILALGYSITYQRKLFTVKAVHGFTRSRTLWGEVLAFSAFFVAAAAILSTVSSLGLMAFNQANQFSSVASSAFLVMGATYLIAILFQVLLFSAVSTTPQVAFLKGARPLGFLLSLSLLTQIFVLGLSYAVLSHTVSLYLKTSSDQGSVSTWLEASNLVTLRFGGSNTPQDFEKITSSVGRLFAAQESLGQAILAYHPRLPSQQVTGYGPNDGNSLIVNNEYLASQDIRSSSGKRIGELPEASGQIYLLVPERVKSQTEAIVEQYKVFADFQVSLNPNETPKTISLTTIYTRNGQKIFNYGSTSVMEETSQSDPVIAVMPAGAGVLSDDFYLSAATNGNAIFINPEALIEQLRGSELEQRILSVDTISDYALASIDLRKSQIIVYISGIALILLVMMFSSSIMALVYCDRNKQALFAKYALGWSFFRTHRHYLAAVLGLGLTVLAGCGVLGAVNSLAGYTAAAGAIVLNMVITVVLIRFHQRKFRSDFLRRY
ncbi:MAG: hypothetical protein ACRCSP_08475 [Rhodoglobus sp.]